MTRKWKCIWPYLLFVSSISILGFANARLIQVAINDSKLFARIINVAGKQRMLSQKIVTETLLLSSDPAQIQLLKSDLELWDSVHHALQKPDNQYGIDILRFPSTHTLFAKLNPIETDLYHVVKDYYLSPDGAKQRAIVDLQSKYLPLMDELVFSLQSDAEMSFDSVKDRQVLLVVLSVVILLLEILLIIFPYHKKLLSSYKELKRLKEEVEEQQEEIKTQNDSLLGQNAMLDSLHRTEYLTLTGINAGIWNWNIQTGQENWSNKFFELLGYEPGEIPATFDTFLNILLHPEDKEIVSKAIDAHLKDAVHYSLNIRMFNKSGVFRWYETSGEAARDSSGVPIQMAGSIIDINDKVIYQQQLEEINATKDKLFAIVAHDLRSPIATIKSLLDFVKEDMISHEEFIVYINQTSTNIAALSATLDNVLQWALSQMNGFTKKEEVLDLGKVVDEAILFYQSSAKDKGIVISIQISGMHSILADKNHILLAIRNILNNAIKFTPSGGHVVITIDSELNTEKITIHDTGIGMSDSDIASVFKKGYVTSKRGTNDEKGTGLGLALSIKAIQENEGTLEIISHAGKGSSFILRFPKNKI